MLELYYHTLFVAMPLFGAKKTGADAVAQAGGSTTSIRSVFSSKPKRRARYGSRLLDR